MNFKLLCLLLFLSVTAEAQVPGYRFLPNNGQWHKNVRYKAVVPTGNMYLETNAITYQFLDLSEMMEYHVNPGKKPSGNLVRQHVVRTEFVGAAVPATSHKGKSPEYFNFFRGNDPSKWVSNVYGFEEVLYENIYPGISLKFHTQSMDLKYDLIVEPYADPSLIQLKYTGADQLQIRKGELHIETSLGKIIEQKPFVYQIINGKTQVVPCKFVLKENILSFEFPEGYSQFAELVIDPTLIFASYSGSFADNFGMTATYDDYGNFYAGGMAYDAGYPTTTGAYDNTSNPNGTLFGITDVVITKYTPDGTGLIYSTYLGGGDSVQGTETVHSLVVNGADELCLYGVTSSTDFPTTAGAYDNTFNGGSNINFGPNGTTFSTGTDIYIAKLSTDGTTLLASTLMGGTGNDGINYTNSTAYDSLQRNYGDQFRGEIITDDQNNIYVATCTKSPDFPIVNGFGTTLTGGQAGVVMKLDPNLSTLLWSSYLNGEEKDAAYSVKVADDYSVYVTGGTSSPGFPVTAGAYQNTYGGGNADAYITHINNTGSAILSSTFIGTGSYDQAYFIELDRFGDVHVVGQTLGAANWPVTPGVYQNTNSCQFITSLDEDLSVINYSTTYGNGNGQINISPAAFLVDHCGNIYVSGWGANILQNNPLTNMPITASTAYQPNSGDGFNFHLIVLEREATSLLYATYFGGAQSREHVDGGTSRFDKNGVVYQSVCAGCGGNSDFPTTPGVWSNTNNSTNCNNGVFKFDFEILPVAEFTVDNLTGCAPLTVTFTNGSINNTNYLWDFGNGDTTSINPNPVRTYADTGTFYVYLAIEDSVCALVDTAVQVITVYPTLELTTMPDTVICDPATFDIWASGAGHNGQYIWSSSNQFTDTLNTNLNDSSLTVSPTLPTYYYVRIENPACSLIDSFYVDFTSNSLSINDVSMCAGDIGIMAISGGSPGDPFVSYDWEADSLIVSGDGTASVSVTATATQYIYVTAISQAGCIVYDSALVSVSVINPGVNAWVDVDTIAFGSGTGAHVTPPGHSYLWSPGSLFSDSTAANTTVTPGSIGDNYFIVQVIEGGCVRSDTVHIFAFEVICGDPDIFIPNAFTPNMDGNNDVLYVRANNLTDLYFTVYNRWGEMMYETRNQSSGWDGKHKGKHVDPDVYVYYLEGICIDGQPYFEKGNVTLIR